MVTRSQCKQKNTRIGKEIKLDVRQEQVEQKKEPERKQTKFLFVIIQDNHKTICMITEKFAARVQRFIKFFA